MQLTMCAICARPTKIRNGLAGVYCSWVCAGTGLGRHPRSHRHGNPPRRFTCACGTPVVTYRKHKRFCSWACSSRGQRHSGGAGPKDSNHDVIVAALRAAGVAVAETHRLGGGFPDLMVARGELVVLIEIKNPHTGYGRRGLGVNQRRFAETWPVAVAYNPAQALAAVGLVA